MLILSENGRKLIDSNALFIREVKDREDETKAPIYKVMANTSGRNETMMTFAELKDAEEFVKKVADKYGAVS